MILLGLVACGSESQPGPPFKRQNAHQADSGRDWWHWRTGYCAAGSVALGRHGRICLTARQAAGMLVAVIDDGIQRRDVLSGPWPYQQPQYADAKQACMAASRRRAPRSLTATGAPGCMRMRRLTPSVSTGPGGCPGGREVLMWCCSMSWSTCSPRRPPPQTCHPPAPPAGRRSGREAGYSNLLEHDTDWWPGTTAQGSSEPL